MPLTTAPKTGDTKQCPQCHDTLVFSTHYPILTLGMALTQPAPSVVGDHIRYKPAWVCRNGGCDYREIVEDS